MSHPVARLLRWILRISAEGLRGLAIVMLPMPTVESRSEQPRAAEPPGPDTPPGEPSPGHPERIPSDPFVLSPTERLLWQSLLETRNDRSAAWEGADRTDIEERRE
ncbi:hypothetical protein [Micromonospora sp. DT233]|uniref:hypothetical protein n=1 Tax=Micromonospora sp. DT233 TaxID=3393432 RepID=UPI003CEC0B17